MREICENEHIATTDLEKGSTYSDLLYVNQSEFFICVFAECDFRITAEVFEDDATLEQLQNIGEH